MRISTVVLLLFLGILDMHAGYYKFIPVDVTQPDKTVIHCYTSGDEYYHWLHDKDGYTIVQSETDGYYYYALKEGDNLIPSGYRVGTINPQTVGIGPWLKISSQKYQDSRSQRSRLKSTSGLATGTLVNIVIYIRFKDDTEFSKTRQEFANMLNGTGVYSLKGYYNEVSYGKLSIESNHYPDCAPSVSLSYQDTAVRAYFSPYNAITNPKGYKDDSGNREQSLVERAIKALQSQIPSNLVVDANGDGKVDNVTIVVRGNADGWGKLLWPHQWWLYMKSAYILGKQVGTYIFITENMFDVGTLCHEMFHVIGAPDLYHYTDNGISPVGEWDIMEHGRGHMLAYMKWKYSGHNWISSIPEITKTGDYSLKPLSTATQNCYKIKSPFSSTEFYTLEFRQKLGLLESNIPASGLIISRINPLANGNGNGPPDEVYVCRPQGTLFSSGNVNGATFTINQNSFDSSTNPRPFLSDGSDAGINISKVAIQGDSVVFHVEVVNPVTQKSLWIVKTDSYENGTANDPGTHATDDNPSTIWHTPWSNTTVPYPHWIKIDFRKSLNIKGFKYLPRQDMENGRIKKYEFYTSNDDATWTKVIADTFSNNNSLQTVTFPERYCRFVKLTAINEINGNAWAAVAELDFIFNTPSLPKTKWKLLKASSFESGNDPKLAFDNDGSTFWHSQWSAPAAQFPHELSVDMGETYCIEGASYLPRQDENYNGTIAKYEFYSSLDGIKWTLLSKGQWPVSFGEELISFPKTVCRYFKIVALSEVNGKAFASIAEIGVFGTKSNDITLPAKPTNFQVASRKAGIIKLTWNKVSTDNTILYYKVNASDTLIGKVYANELSLNIDTTKKYNFSISAVDGSGNQSDTTLLVYSIPVHTGINQVGEKPIVYTFAGKVYLSGLSGDNIITIVDILGRQLLVKRCENADLEISVNNFSGIAIVSIKGNNHPVYTTKVYVDSN